MFRLNWLGWVSVVCLAAGLSSSGRLAANQAALEPPDGDQIAIDMFCPTGLVPMVNGMETKRRPCGFLRSSGNVCLRSPASRDRNMPWFASASVNGRFVDTLLLGRSQFGRSA